MPHVVTEPCINCKYTDCVTVCPMDCFHEGEDRLYIDPEFCIDCRACIALCPVGAIFKDVDVPEKWLGYIQENLEQAIKFPVLSGRKEPLATTAPPGKCGKSP